MPARRMKASPARTRVRACLAAVRRWAVLGRGIAYKSYFDAADDLAAGRLVPLCPGWTTEAVPLFLVAPSRRQFTPLVRALRDFVAGRLQALMARAPR